MAAFSRVYADRAGFATERRRMFEIVDGATNGAERIPIQLEALLAEEEREEEIGADSCFEDGVI